MNKKPVRPDTPGGRIRALRIARGLSQEALAKELGVTQGAVSQFELGETQKLKHDTFLKLTRALETNGDYIFKGHGVGEGMSRESVSLDERELLAFWRALAPLQRPLVLKIVRAAADNKTPSVADPYPGAKRINKHKA